jgi:dihydroorotate dehydrogenase (NAD+) catalytic subunit|uniref:Dihydroorotate dehydrogenase n=1 Tax=candidate division WOR-3 bacterium TaxID=2052148 RepID=A0A7V3RHR8_UNCW3
MIELFGIRFKNPVFLASGVFGFGLKYKTVTRSVGAIFTKGITLKPRQGNPPPRIFETPSGVINSVGLENPGVKEFCNSILPKIKDLNDKIFVNVAGFTIEEYRQIIEEIGEGVTGFELNVSCPNVKEGGVLFGQNPKMVEQIVRNVRRETKLPIIVKLTANFCDPLIIAKVAIEAGANGVSLINTIYGMAFDIKRKKPLIIGGLSGPAIKPFALYCVHRLKELKVPIIGMGGIMTGQDAYEFMLAGASAVAIGTAILRDPYAPIRILKELNSLLKEGDI